MADPVKVGDIMTRDVITVGPHDDLIHAAQLFEKHKFAGLPVVDEKRRLWGLLTSYDMILEGRAHLPNLLGVISKASADAKDGDVFESQLRKIKEVKVKDIMNPDPLVVTAEVHVEDLSGEFIEHHRVNPVPVVDHEKRLVGVVSRYDLIRFFSKHFLMKVLEEEGHHGILQRLTRLQGGEEK